MKTSKKIIFYSVIIFCLSLFWFSFQITKQSIWLDEAATINIISASPGTFWKKVIADKHPPFYYWLLKNLLHNYSLLSVRFFSAICATLTVIFIYYFYQSLCLTLIFMFSPFVFHFAQEGRMYSLNLLLSVIIVYNLEKIIFSKNDYKQLNFILLIIFSIIGFYTHYYFGLLITIAFINLWFYRGKKTSFYYILPIAIAYFPWLKYLLNDIKSGINWNPAYSLQLIPITIFKFILGYSGKLLFFKLTFLGKAFLFYFTLFLFVLSILNLRHNRKKIFFVWGNFFLGLGISSFLAITIFKNSYLPKYLIVFFPFFLKILDTGICKLYPKHRRLFSLNLIILFVFYGISLGIYFTNPYIKGDWKKIFSFLKKAKIQKVYLYPDYLDLPFKVSHQSFKILILKNSTAIIRILKNKPHNCAIVIQKKYFPLSKKILSRYKNYDFLRVKILF